ncbi:MAG: mannosyltransferase [Bacteroidota bacterium]
MERHLHHISFDIPFPANYGGVIEVYYKLQALAEAGVKIHLHCFEYGREPSEELERLCASVQYYPRKQRFQSLPVRYPHIVKSRRSKALLRRLIQEPHPILFEGLHTTYYLSHPELENRRKVVRLHNVEWEYYYALAQWEPGYMNRQYFLAESRQLQAWEDVLPFADHLLPISPKDTNYYAERFKNVDHLPPFHGNRSVSSRPGQGDYCLYHGKLSVPENHEAAMFLVEQVFADFPVPLIIAGGGARPELIEAISENDQILLRPDPGEAEMEDLIRNAHILVLPTFQATGIKLKLLNSLFNGRHVMVNPPMVLQTPLAKYCHIADDAPEFQKQILQLFDRAFSEGEIEQRRQLLANEYDNQQNVQKLLEILYPKDLMAR